ncbi:MAG: hypothetical protein JNK23_17750 [Opitutaceae bacterium]|nr:hypothetical protein [Opitutaceae bacterium]
MNAPLIPGAAPVAAGLHTRRCARHPGREAAARCPACTEFFCRECIVEHGGRLLCSACLARRAVAAEQRRSRFRGLRRGVRTGAGVIALWLVFYWVGALLLKVPRDVHDGAIWKKLGEGARP